MLDGLYCSPPKYPWKGKSSDDAVHLQTCTHFSGHPWQCSSSVSTGSRKAPGQRGLACPRRMDPHKASKLPYGRRTDIYKVDLSTISGSQSTVLDQRVGRAWRRSPVHRAVRPNTESNPLPDANTYQYQNALHYHKLGNRCSGSVGRP